MFVDVEFWSNIVKYCVFNEIKKKIIHLFIYLLYSLHLLHHKIV